MLLDQVRHMLRLDEDLSAFYAMAAADPVLAWVPAGAGRMLRSPSVFEDLVKTICTTNCTWSATVRMVTALVDTLGVPASPTVPSDAHSPRPRPWHRRTRASTATSPAPATGAPYLRALASDVAEGRLDLEALGDPALGDDEVAEQLLATGRRGALRDGAHDDAARPLPAAYSRFLDAPQVPPPKRTPARDR